MTDDFKWKVCLGVILLVGWSAVTHAVRAGQNEKPRIIIKAEPDRLLLGQSQDAIVYAKVVDETGKVVPHASIVLQANIGTIKATAKEHAGEVAAVYVPPEQYFPQWAVITALARLPGKTLHGRYNLPLIGLGKAVVESEPNVFVTLEIGENTFGPVKSDKHGSATFDIIAPPGTSFGRAGGGDVDLGLPEMNLINVIPENQLVVAGDEQGTPLWIHAIDRKGDPLTNGTIAVSAERGRVSKAKQIEAGLYRADYFAPRKIESGEDVVSLEIQGQPASKQTVVMNVVSGIATRLEVKATPDFFVADSGENPIVEARIYDREGNPVPAEVEFRTNVGETSRPWVLGPGRYGAIVKLPHEHRNVSSARVKVRVRAGKTTLQKHCEISLRPGEPQSIEFAKETLLFERGRNTTNRIVARVMDAHGNLITDAVLRLAVSEGRLPQQVVQAAKDRGEFEFTYLPARDSDADVVRLDASAGQVKTTVFLRGRGQSYLSLAPQLGFVTNFSYYHSPYATLSLIGNLEMFVKGLFLFVEGAYLYSKEEEQKLFYKSVLHMIPLTAGGGYRIRINHLLRFSARLGMGVNIALARKQQKGTADVKQSEATFGFNAVVGLHYRLGIGELVTELGYLFARIRRLEEHTGVGGGMLISIGYQFSFLNISR